ncbi:kelch repeat-containing protein [Hyphococcus flavus]|uniref:Kelch repeat-containing protein n=1 Tax=Hyphococcus flavus TaxID=1866326 RepID=A0AAE9ZB54_9PROT|nr:kelch repeat-containing protein [Hyphococcus flavus]WDI31264.1 kelch repeat-containing protein [Hyphococcus flavus]
MKTWDRRSFLVGSAAVSAGAAIPLAARADDPMGAWTPLANMPFAVQEIYPAPFRKTADPAANLKPSPLNLIVNAGGLVPDGAFNVTDAVTFYDPAYDAWGYGTPLPEPRHHVALVNNNGLLYAVGGFARDARGGWQMRGQCWRIRDLNGRWETMAPLPHPQAEMAAVSLGGYLHVVGGRAPAGSLNAQWADHIDTDEHWVFDAAANRWLDAAPMPTPRNSAAGCVVNGVLYVIGGRTVNDGNLSTVEVYDPLSDRWAQASPMPKAQGGLAAAVMNGKIYAFGGEYFNPAPGGVFAEAWEYNPDTDKWRAVAAMPRRRHGLGAVSLGNAIYVLGGASGVSSNGTSNALDRFEI